MTSAYQTLSNGTLIDFDLDESGRLVIRAGKALRPTSRPIVLELTRPVEILRMINNLLAMYGTARGVDMPAIFSESLVEDQVVMLARESHDNGATHDCGEWVKAGKCQVCDREIKED